MFIWKNTKEFNLGRLILATFIPSGIAYFGFHFILPGMIEKGVSVLLGYGAVASSMLFFLLVFTITILFKESKKLGVSFKERMMLKRVGGRNLLISLGIFIIIMILVGLGSSISRCIVERVGIEVPKYLPFFLNPTVDSTTADPMVLTNGISLVGRWDIFILLIVTLILNILTEELYFRAWILPKLWKSGKWSWVINGTLFALYHTFQLWLLPVILVASLGFAFICYKTKSIIPAFVFHIITNVLSVIALFPLFI